MKILFNVFVRTHIKFGIEIFEIDFVFVCLFDLVLYVPVNNFSVMSGRVVLG